MKIDLNVHVHLLSIDRSKRIWSDSNCEGENLSIKRKEKKEERTLLTFKTCQLMR